MENVTHTMENLGYDVSYIITTPLDDITRKVSDVQKLKVLITDDSDIYENTNNTLNLKDNINIQFNKKDLNKEPNNGDIIHFQTINRLYEVKTVTKIDRFNYNLNISRYYKKITK